MNCFYHPETSAVGLCKCCNKGLCFECATDLGFGLACKGKHEPQVETINMIVEKNARAYAAAPKSVLIAPLFYLFMGLVFAVFGYQSRDGVTSLAFIMGAGFIAFAIVVFVRNREMFGSEKNSSQNQS